MVSLLIFITMETVVGSLAVSSLPRTRYNTCKFVAIYPASLQQFLVKLVSNLICISSEDHFHSV